VSQPNPAPAGPAPTGTPAPAGPASYGQQPSGQSGQTDAEVRDPDAKLASEEAAQYRKKLRAAEQELEKLKVAHQTDAEKAIALAKQEGATEYKARYAKAVAENAALSVLAEKRVVATELALRALDLGSLEVDIDTGRVDNAQLSRLVDALIQRYPMLVEQGPAQLPNLGQVQGADQRRVQLGQVVSPQQDERAKLNNLARYALGAEGT
jgi:hypothetical protein